MRGTVEGAGVELAYEERGEGPPVVVVHGMASCGADWSALAEELSADARVVTYDRRGYGSSGAPEPYERTTVNEQAEDLAALIAALGLGTVVALGVDLGALVVLDLLDRHRGLVRAAALVDAPLFAFVPEATEALAAERLALEETLREAGGAEAVALYLSWQEAPSERTARASAHARAFFADYAGLATLPLTRRELRGIAAPLIVLDSPTARPHQRAASDALAELSPRAVRDGTGLAASLRTLVGG